MTAKNAVVETYSRLAAHYDGQDNQESCWGRATATALSEVSITPTTRRVLDVGCGTGRAVASLALEYPTVEFVGVEPADRMREMAAERAGKLDNVAIADGRFESIPLDDDFADYVFSIMAFHWTTDVEASARELARVLAPDGRMDLFFIGRKNGAEFIRATTPIFLRHMGPELLLKAAAVRKQLTLKQATELFASVFGPERVQVNETFTTYHDTLERHWSWWVRIEGQFVDMPDDVRTACDDEVRAALAGLATDEGIPYTIHRLHVSIS